jgi:hypothetical protein
LIDGLSLLRETIAKILRRVLSSVGATVYSSPESRDGKRGATHMTRMSGLSDN